MGVDYVAFGALGGIAGGAAEAMVSRRAGDSFEGSPCARPNNLWYGESVFQHSPCAFVISLLHRAGSEHEGALDERLQGLVEARVDFGSVIKRIASRR